MHGSELDPSVSAGIGLYFLLIGLANAGFAWCLLFHSPKEIGSSREGVATIWQLLSPRNILAAFWVMLSIYLLGTGVEFAQGRGIILSASFRDTVDSMLGPTTYFMSAVLGFVLLLYCRKWFSTGFGGWFVLDASLIFIGYSITDPDFRAIVAKPDNVPISMLIYSVGFTTWLAFRQAVRNDERIAEGKKPFEAEGAEKVLTWPDLVYTELLAMVLFTVFLLVWSILIKAPLEPPASTTQIPNPSKAPWYFLGLQEMLVYFDPWLAGVVLPTYIVIGLCAIPYLDYNKKGAGYYTFNDRPFAITTFLFGFVVLWVTLIVLGTFLRGPNWNFFGFYEEWTPYKVEALNNINLSDMYWISLLGQAVPNRDTHGDMVWLLREWPGMVIVLAYFALPPLLFVKFGFPYFSVAAFGFKWFTLREMYLKMGLIRYMTLVHILLMMALLPLKMFLRWTFNLKYLVFIPEYFFNI